MPDFLRYLEAKRSVDDRALNRRVWERLREELRPEDPVRVADVGAGIGTGAERMRDWELVAPPRRLDYTAVEPRRDLLDEARRRLSFLRPGATLVPADLETFAKDDANAGRFRLVVAHAVLDILDLAKSLPLLVRLAGPGGLLYFPITFDGETIFEPAHRDDEAILAVYHETMNAKGSPRTGRRLFRALLEHPVEILEVGGSDWIVHPVGGSYPSDEAFFLRFLLETIEGAVRDRVEPSLLAGWLSLRRRQLEEATLFYGAHQLDYLARRRV